MINLEADLIESSLREESINIKKKNLPTLNRKKPELNRTLVRRLSELVEVAGIEPASANLLLKGTTCLVCVL